MVPMGSYGDILPHVVIGSRLASLGHTVTIAEGENYRRLVEGRGLNFLRLGSRQDIADYHREAIIKKKIERKEYVNRVFVPYAEELADLLTGSLKDRFSHAIASHNALGLKFFQPGFRRVAILVLSSYFMDSYVFRKHLRERGVWSELRRDVRGFWRRWTKGRYLDASSKGFREWMVRRGLPDEHDVYEAVYRDSLHLALYPAWFERDFLRLSSQLQFTGFPLESGALAGMVSQSSNDLIDAFTAKHRRYAVVTVGTPLWPSKAFLQTAALQLDRLGIPSIVVNQLYAEKPSEFGPNSLAIKMVPFGRILKHACLFVHHGGIGTIGQACASGVPQLVIPRGLDQFENASMIRSLGLGDFLPLSRASGGQFSRKLQSVLENPQIAGRARDVRADSKAFDGVNTASRILDSWVRRGG